MVEFLVKRPVAVIMTFIAFLILGLAAMNLIPISLLPDIAIPEITIQVSAPDKPVNEMEQNYIRPIRRQMLQLGHLNDIQSVATNEQGTVRLTFKYGTDINYAFVEVNEKMDGLMPSMPSDFERPRIIKASATDIPVFYMTVMLKQEYADERKERFMELSEFCEQVIKKRVEQLPEVAMVDISGMEYPEIRISADLDKLRVLGIDYSTIQSALEENNISLGNIRVRNGMYEFNVKYATLLKNRRDIEQISLRSGDRIFTLGELTKIEVRPKSGKGVFVDKKGQAIIMAVIKKSDARMEDLKEQTGKLMDNLNEDYPRLRFELSRNQTELLDYSISNLQSSLIIGGILAFLIMLLFLKDLKSPILIGVSIPVSLVVSLLFFYLFNLSINIISLSGLILGVGMMIDNSIIVIDNISQYYSENRKGVIQATIAGTNEVIRPLISSVLTTCAVFVPLIFLSGIAGALFYDQAMAITIGLGASLIVSITLIPVLYAVFYRRTGKKPKARVGEKPKALQWMQFYRNIENSYARGYDWIFANRRWFLVGTFLFILVGVWAFSALTKERFPAFEQTEAEITIDWNRNIGVNENQRRMEELRSAIDSLTVQLSCMVGEQSFILEQGDVLGASEAKIYFQAENAVDRKDALNEVRQWMTANYPEALYEISPPETIFEKIFGDNESPLEIRLWTDGSTPVPDPEVLNKIAADITKLFAKSPERKAPLQEYYEISPRFDRIKLYDIPVARLTSVLKKSLNRLSLFTLRQGQYEVPVVLTGKQQDIYTVIRSVRVQSNAKGQVPVDQLVTVRRIAGYKLLQGGKEGGYASLSFDITDNELGVIQRQVHEVLKSYPNVHVKFAGSLFANRELFKELVIVLVVALLLLYFILASQFESVLQPFIVFIEIPIDIAGALLLLWLSGNSLNLMSMIGIVVMTGIIINDSILKIDTINGLVRNGQPVLEAIHIGGRRRLKPILMTSATTILAMVPFLWGHDMGSRLQQPLAWAIIGGMTIGTFVSLYFVPLAYYYLNRNKNLNIRSAVNPNTKHSSK